MKRIFTRTLFSLSSFHQSGVVDAEVSALQRPAAVCVDQAGRQELMETGQRIKQQAIELGICTGPRDDIAIGNRSCQLRQLMFPFATTTQPLVDGQVLAGAVQTR